MTDDPLFFVLVFSSEDAGENRIEVAVKALSEQHVISLASHFAEDGRGAIAISQSGDHLVAGGDNVEIVARFGDVPEGWTFGRTPITSKEHASLPVSTRSDTLGMAQSLGTLIATQAQILREGSMLSRAIASLVIIALAVGGGSLVALAKGEQREARLVEMARPACSHSGIENKELRGLVKQELRTGLSKQHVLYAVLDLCQANLRES
jgi:hypothetical protein